MMQQAYVDNQIFQIEQSFANAVLEMKNIIASPVAEQESAQHQMKQMQQSLMKQIAYIQAQLDAHAESLLAISNQTNKSDILVQNTVNNAEQKLRFALYGLEDFKNELSDGYEIKFGLEKEKLLYVVEKFLQQRYDSDRQLTDERLVYFQQLQQNNYHNLVQLGQQLYNYAVKTTELGIVVDYLQRQATNEVQQTDVRLVEIEKRCGTVEQRLNAESLKLNRGVLEMQQNTAALKADYQAKEELIAAIQRDCSENLTQQSARVTLIYQVYDDTSRQFAQLRSDFIQLRQPTEGLQEKMEMLSKTQQISAAKYETVISTVYYYNIEILEKVGQALRWQLENERFVVREREQQDNIRDIVYQEVQQQLWQALGSEETIRATKVASLVEEVETRLAHRFDELYQEMSGMRKDFESKLAELQAKVRENELVHIYQRYDIIKYQAELNSYNGRYLAEVIAQSNYQMLEGVNYRLAQTHSLVKESGDLLAGYKQELLVLYNQINSIRTSSVLKEDIYKMADSINQCVSSSNARLQELEGQCTNLRYQYNQANRIVYKDYQQFRAYVLEQLLAANKAVKIEVVDILKVNEYKQRQAISQQAIEKAVFVQLEYVTRLLRDELVGAFTDKLAILQNSINETQKQFTDNAQTVKQYFSKVDKIMTGFARDNYNLRNDKAAIYSVFLQAYNQIKTEFYKYKELISILEMKLERAGHEQQAAVSKTGRQTDGGVYQLQKQLDYLQTYIMPLLMPNENAYQQFGYFIDQFESKKYELMDMFLAYQDTIKTYVQQQRREIEESISYVADQSVALVKQVADRNSDILLRSLPDVKRYVFEQITKQLAEVRTENEGFYKDFVISYQHLQIEYAVLYKAVQSTTEKPLIDSALFDGIHEKLAAFYIALYHVGEEAGMLRASVSYRCYAYKDEIANDISRLSDKTAKLERDITSILYNSAGGSRKENYEEAKSALAGIALIDSRIETHFARFEATSVTSVKLQEVLQELSAMHDIVDTFASGQNISMRYMQNFLAQAVDFREASEEVLRAAKEDARGLIREIHTADWGNMSVMIKNLYSAVRALGGNQVELYTGLQKLQEHLGTNYLTENIRKPLLLMQSDIVGIKQQLLNDLLPAALGSVKDKLVQDLNAAIYDAFYDTHTALSSVYYTRDELYTMVISCREEQTEHAYVLKTSVNDLYGALAMLRTDWEASSGDAKSSISQLKMSLEQMNSTIRYLSGASQQSGKTALDAFEYLTKQLAQQMAGDVEQLYAVFTKNVHSSEERIMYQYTHFAENVGRKVDSNIEQMFNYERAAYNQREQTGFLLYQFDELLKQQETHLSAYLEQLIERVAGVSGLKQYQNTYFREYILAYIADLEARLMGLLYYVQQSFYNSQNSTLQTVSGYLDKYAAKYSGLCEDLHILRADVTYQLAYQLTLQKQHQELSNSERSAYQQYLTQLSEQLQICQTQAYAALVAAAEFDYAIVQANARFAEAVSQSVSALNAERQRFYDTEKEVLGRLRMAEESTRAFYTYIRADLGSIVSKEVPSVSFSSAGAATSTSGKTQQLVYFANFYEFDRIDVLLRQYVGRIVSESYQRGLEIKQCKILKVKNGIYEVDFERITVSVGKNNQNSELGGVLSGVLASGKRVDVVEWIYDHIVKV